jgi:DUF1680 family protein
MPKEDLTKLFTEGKESTPELQQHVTSFYELLMQERDLKKKLDDIKEQRMVAEETLHASLEDIGWELIRTGDGTFSRRIDFFANFAPEQKEAGYTWLRELGFGDLIYETVNARTFAAFVKDLKKNDEMAELPEFVNTGIRKKIGFRKK